MEAVIRHVRDIAESERHMLEELLGRQLQENQQLIIQVVNLGNDVAPAPQGNRGLS